jgi:predicted nuclease of predicted toxin-antitoxin system
VGRTDSEILRHAHEQRRVVMTHDSDFGGLAIARKEPFTGIVYLRPGHIESRFVLEMLRVVESTVREAAPPFLLVAERRSDRVRLRLRRGS